MRCVGEVLDDASAESRQTILTCDRDDVRGVRVMNTPWKITGLRATVRLPPPHLGEHNIILASHRPLRDGQGA